LSDFGNFRRRFRDSAGDLVLPFGNALYPSAGNLLRINAAIRDRFARWIPFFGVLPDPANFKCL